MSLEPAQLLPVAFAATDIAKEIMLSRPPASWSEKSERDLVSELDIQIERTLREYLSRETPEIGFLGEEEGHTGSPDGFAWTLDPIDGTSNFVHRIPLCAISLALTENGKPLLGVIDAPLLGLRYHAIENGGAFRGDQPLHVSSTAQLKDAIVAIGDYAVGDRAASKNATRLALTKRLAEQAHRVRMLGTSALDLAWVAEGALDASVTLSNKPWDTAAGTLLVREAGGVVGDSDGSEHTDRSKATIATNPALQKEILALVQEARTSLPARARRAQAASMRLGARM